MTLHRLVKVVPQSSLNSVVPGFCNFSTMRSVDKVCPLVKATGLRDEAFDGVVAVSSSYTNLDAGLIDAIQKVALLDKTVEGGITLVHADDLPSKRLIFSATGPLNRDYDDVRRYYDAAVGGIDRALKAGCKSPLLILPGNDAFPEANLSTVMGALHSLYLPIELREAGRSDKADKLGIWSDKSDDVDYVVKLAPGLEAGRLVGRDIGGSDPERMAPPNVEKYVREVFNGTSIKVESVSDVDTLTKDYPLLAAVNRACRNVDRHKGRVVFLTYEGEGPIEETLLFVGKGICYDTGGADIKAGGVMAGMHRDKCGAANVAGLFQTLDVLKPKGLKVLGAMCLVRNSVGSECYVADEIITSRAGVRVRVGNTDAEGRMVMADVLCHMKEKALTQVNPKIFTWATLTGHVIIAHGDKYSAVMGNGPSCKLNLPNKLIEAGEQMADCCALSTITREDYKFAAGKSEYEDVLQCNNAASSRTPRGHQFPAAFMVLAAGLDKHGKDSDKPLCYTHVDIAGSSGPFPGVPTGSPILAFSKAFIMNRI